MIDANEPRLTHYERELIPMRGDGRFKNDREMIDCCALGLTEESAEVLCAIDGTSGDADVLAELGDVLWYATTAAHRLDRTIAHILENVETTTEQFVYNEDEDYARALLMYSGLFAGLVKKWLYHDKPLNADLAAKYIAEILECVARIASQLGHTLTDAQYANLAKLRKRFPSGGFTAAEANARADEKGGA